ncbi:MAG: response regulator, partial [Planctomycetota bacterium]
MSKDKSVILVIDDDPDFLDFTCSLLATAGYLPLKAQNRYEAMKILRQSSPHLILMDINMPDISGLDLYKEIQKWSRLSSVPLIFVTAEQDETIKGQALAMGAADLLSKPIKADELLRRVSFQIQAYLRWKELDDLAKGKWLSTSQGSGNHAKTSFQTSPQLFEEFRKLLVSKKIVSLKDSSQLFSLSPKELYTFSAEKGISEKRLAQEMAEFLQIPFLDYISPKSVQKDIFPLAFSQNHKVLALQDNLGNRVYALTNPFDWDLMELLKLYHPPEKPFFIAVTTPTIIQKILQGRFEEMEKQEAQKAQEFFKTLEEQLKEKYGLPNQDEVEMVEEDDEEAEPLILLINQIIEEAYELGASDIHIEPWEKEVVLRYRIDGTLRIVKRLTPQSIIRPLVARIKVMSNLNIAEKRLPQDGRIVFKHFTKKNLDFDLRVSTAPMNFGEKVVMRILDKQKSVWPLEKLGFSEVNLNIYREAIRSPYGMILHVGPTGSGKSMTLYAALNEIISPEINIQTIEDPIEYTVPGINQLQINHDAGLDFAMALRSFLRQDPDVILVGEIRDKETAEIAIEAALTGHLLFSTLHTNDAATTVTRFVEMGIEPFMISSSLVVVCAQRLVRRLCQHCKEPYSISSAERKLIETSSELTLYRPTGCKNCNFIGYKGRMGIHELFQPNDEIRDAINREGISADELKKMAVQKMDMTTLYWDGIYKVIQGHTSLEEILARVRRDGFSSKPKWLSRIMDGEDGNLVSSKVHMPEQKPKEKENIQNKENIKVEPIQRTSNQESIQDQSLSPSLNYQDHSTSQAPPSFLGKMEKLKQIYIQQFPKKLEIILKLWSQWKEKKEKNTLKELSQIFHKISGSGGTYGFSNISETGKALEQLTLI